MIDMDEQWTRANPVLWRRSGGTVVLMTYDDGQLLTLNDSGSDLWSLLEEPATLRQLASDLSSVYGVPLEQVLGDLTVVMADLEGRRLVRRLVA